MSYISSDDVTVFPSSLRSAENGDRASGKYTSEENLTGMIKTLANKDSFIISWPTDNSENEAEIVINGYYFKFKTNNLSTSGNLYAGIKLDSSKRLSSLDSSDTRLDVSGSFRGLGFQTNTSGFNYYLKLLENGNVVSENFHKFDAKTIFLDDGNGNTFSLTEIFSGYNSGDLLVAQETGAPIWTSSTTVVNSALNNLPTGSGNNLNTSYIITNNTGDTNFRKLASANIKVGGLLTGRTLKVNLSSSNASTAFDGTSNITDIGVSGTLPISRGGTGQTSAQGIRNALGLGNTTGALLVANGGTGVTSIADIQAGKDGSGNTITSTYVKKSGDTMTGNLYVTTNMIPRLEAMDTTHGGGVYIGFGSGHRNHGLYSTGYAETTDTWTNDGGWMVYRTSTGDVILNGNALTATKATQDGSGNTITSTYLSKTSTSSQSMSGILQANNNTSYTTRQVRNIILSTSSTPTGGSNGDIWITYSN